MDKNIAQSQAVPLDSIKAKPKSVSERFTDLQTKIGTKTDGVKSAKSDKEDFLKYLNVYIASLKNQDPFEPMDASKMMDGAKSMFEMKMQTSMNDKMDRLVEAYEKRGQFADLLPAVGKIAMYEGNISELRSGKAVFLYNITSDSAASAKIQITDQNGRAVYTSPVPVKVGENTFIWDGDDLVNKSKAKDGLYKFRVVLYDADNKPQADGVTTYSLSAIEGVEVGQKQEQALLINGQNMSLSSIHRILDNDRSSSSSIESVLTDNIKELITSANIQKSI